MTSVLTRPPGRLFPVSRAVGFAATLATLATLATVTAFTAPALSQGSDAPQASGLAVGADLPMSHPDDILASCGGDPEAGRVHFEALCAACHTLGADETHAAGPNLHGLYGRVAGSLDGVAYTPFLRTAGQSGLVWGRESLRAFLIDPEAVVPGSAHGDLPPVTEERLRTDLMTYVRLTTTPPPPAPEDVVVPEDVLAMEGDVAYGAYLASECAACHLPGRDSASGVPAIDGLGRDEMIRALFQYRVGARPNQAMVTVAARLGDEEILALAAYFAAD